MRFGLRASSVADVNKVATSLITSRRVIFVPNVEIKDELAKTSINITCYDRDGKIVKRVTSSDDGTVEDPEGGDDPSTGGSGQVGGETPSGGGSETPSGGGTTGGETPSGGGTNTGGGDNGGDDEPGGDDH